jgi:TatD DNase family protein
MIDTHAHIYLKELASERATIIERAKVAGIQRIYMPAIDSSEVDSLIETEEQYPDFCLAMMGLHPCYVKENYQDELALVEYWLGKRKFAAVGEIGLDRYWDRTYDHLQMEAFQKQMEWALVYDLPVVIHTREAMEATIDAVIPFAERGLRGIFHCFGGNEEQAVRIIRMGFCLGIGGVVTYKKSGLAEVLQSGSIPLDALVLETDSPYLSPVPYRGKQNEPAYMPLVAQRLAEVKGLEVREVIACTTRRALEIFGK